MKEQYEVVLFRPNMKNETSKLARLGLAGILAVAGAVGCDNSSRVQPAEYETIRGRPLSVASASKEYGADLTTIIDYVGKKIIDNLSSSHSNIAKAQALIQSEINDGDDEDIEIMGRYNKFSEEFYISSLKANGHTLE